MSFPAMAWAVRQKLPCTQKIVLMMLADRHNKDTGQCNPSHDLLADDCGLTRRSVMDQIAKLAEAGYLRIRHRAANNVKLPNQYILIFSFGVQEEVKDYVDVVNEVHHGSEPRSLGVVNHVPGVVNHVHQGSEPRSLGVVNHVPGVVNHVHQGSEPRSHKPGIEPGREPKEKKSADAPSLFVLPDWINKAHWDAWHSSTKRKKTTDEQKQLAVETLAEWRDEGVDFAAALKNAALGGWQGLFKPDEKKPVRNAAPQPETFAERDARNGREAWERMTGRQWPVEELPSSARPSAPAFVIDIEATETRRLSA